MSLLFVMSASGSFMVLFYILLKYLAGRYISAKWKSRILRVALFFYLCPFQLIKIYLQRYYYRYWRELFKPKIMYYRDRIQLTPKAIPTFSFNITYKYFYLAGLAITILILFYGVIIYRKQKKGILIHSEELTCNRIRTSVAKQVGELRIRRKITCRFCKDAEPVSVGILHPVIILSDPDQDEHTLGWILKHELIHIKNHDVFMRTLSMAAFAVNFYNPLAFYLLMEMIRVSEMVCDEEVTASLNEEERIQYCKLLFETACKKRKRFLLAAQFNNHFQLKERIELILKGRTEKNIRGAFAAAVIIIFSVVTGLSSMAVYAQPQIIDLRNTEMEIEHGYDNHSFMFFIEEEEDDEVSWSAYMNEDEIELRQDLQLKLDGNFVDKAGNKFPAEVFYEKECEHHYDLGKYYRHSKNDEGCIYYVYDTKRCRNCGVMLAGVLECKLVSSKCSHKE